MNIDRYFNRLNVAGQQAADRLSFLELLQMRHVQTISFENLDIMEKQTLSMQFGDLERKIIERSRGGVCYELNGLFRHLLCHLEYDARLAAATTYIGDRWNPYEDTHMMILAHVDNQSYVVEVGLGGNSPSKPVPLNGKEVRDVDGVYRVVREEDMYYLQKNENQDWNNLYRFRMDEKQTEDFVPWCDFVQTSPESPFNKKRFISRVTQQGRVTLSGDSLTKVENGVKDKRVLQADEIAEALKRWFYLDERQ
ncbi:MULTISPECIES: arylamine N-acetyltransferase [unclassified Paenibacillus]|uniref:arylamine N-acetyltransferase family protein n=1 Tax=unclassified Paenibacillus TaxID=185978 RepID=UPI001C11CCF1|nr:MULTISPECIES: arylamine N-acetyltransferase [unclassified Paenibacillus]MBU5443416.1 arylamine N-acetyltransferase [Paenibacillus sp. MSJ-34]CAH0122455.1 Arylamine N-acetyltransferase [Paenibacillus sp. CECT 9249]